MSEFESWYGRKLPAITRVVPNHECLPIKRIAEDAWRDSQIVNTEFISTNKECMSGVPCLKGHRIPVAQILAELAAGYTIFEIADDLNLDPCKIKGMLQDIAYEYNNKSSS